MPRATYCSVSKLASISVVNRHWAPPRLVTTVDYLDGWLLAGR